MSRSADLEAGLRASHEGEGSEPYSSDGGEEDAGEEDDENQASSGEAGGSRIVSSVVFLFTWWVKPLKRLNPFKRRGADATVEANDAELLSPDQVDVSKAVSEQLAPEPLEPPPPPPPPAPTQTPPLQTPPAAPPVQHCSTSEYYATPVDLAARHDGSEGEGESEGEEEGDEALPPVRQTWISWLFGRRSAPTLEGDSDEEVADAREVGANKDVEADAALQRAAAPTPRPPLRYLAPSPGGTGDSRSESRNGPGSGSDGNSASASASASDASDTAPSPMMNPSPSYAQGGQPPPRWSRDRPIAPRRSPHLNSREAEERLAMIRRRIARQCGERNGPQSDEEDEEGEDEDEELSEDEGSGEGSEDEGDNSDENGEEHVDGRRGGARAGPGGGGHHYAHASPSTPRGHHHHLHHHHCAHPNDGASSRANSLQEDTDGCSTFIRRDVTTDAGHSESHTDRSGGFSSDTPTRHAAALPPPGFRPRAPPGYSPRRPPPKHHEAAYSSECSRDGDGMAYAGSDRDDLYYSDEDGSGSGSSEGDDEYTRGRGRGGGGAPSHARYGGGKGGGGGGGGGGGSGPTTRAQLAARMASRDSRSSCGGYSMHSQGSIDLEDATMPTECSGDRGGHRRPRERRDTVDTRSSGDGPYEDDDDGDGGKQPSRGGLLSRLWGGAAADPPDHSSTGEETPQQPGLVTRWWSRGTTAAAASSVAVAPDHPSPRVISAAAAATSSAIAMPGREQEDAAAVVLSTWSEDQVCEWLAASDPLFEAYLPSFRENHIDGRALTQLTREDLADLGVRSVGHRLAILRARADLGVPTTPTHQRGV